MPEVTDADMEAQENDITAGDIGPSRKNRPIFSLVFGASSVMLVRRLPSQTALSTFFRVSLGLFLI